MHHIHEHLQNICVPSVISDANLSHSPFKAIPGFEQRNLGLFLHGKFLNILEFVLINQLYIYSPYTRLVIVEHLHGKFPCQLLNLLVLVLSNQSHIYSARPGQCLQNIYNLERRYMCNCLQEVLRMLSQIFSLGWNLMGMYRFQWNMGGDTNRFDPQEELLVRFLVEVFCIQESMGELREKFELSIINKNMI